jgi:hypothetical protein
MKTMNWVSGILVVGLLAFAGCGKSDTGSYQSIPAAMDITKFRAAFPSPTPEQRDNFAKACDGVRYGLYPNALAALDKLSNDASLTDAQKKAVADLTEGIKQTMAKAAAPPKQ